MIKTGAILYAKGETTKNQRKQYEKKNNSKSIQLNIEGDLKNEHDKTFRQKYLKHQA